MVPRSKLWIFPEKSEAGSVIPEVTGLRCAGLTAVTWGSSQVGGLLCYENPRALHPCGLWGQPWCHTIASTHQAVLVLLSLFQGFRDLSLAGEAPAHPFGLGSQFLCS